MNADRDHANLEPDQGTEPDTGRSTAHDADVTASVAGRSVLGGVMMGLANLVPGISGGTMLLAAGVYPRFIQAVADVSTLKFRRNSLIVLGLVVIAALAAIVLLAGPVKELVVNHRWAMYSLFIGLTLGGVPVVWRLITASEGPVPKSDPRIAAGAVAGFIVMTALAVFQMKSANSASNDGWIMMLLAGVAGASAMILPGVSGGYLLLVLGVYVPILGGIDTFKDALKAGDLGAMTGPGLAIILPVGLGVLVGVAGVSNLLKWLLARFERITLGFLLGLLVGAVVGLWPFQRGRIPEAGETVKGQEVRYQMPAEADSIDPSTGEETPGKPIEVPHLVGPDGTAEPLEAEDYPTEFFSPDAATMAGAVGLIILGFGITLGVARLGRDKPERSSATPDVP